MLSIEELFCIVDDFCNVFLPQWNRLMLESGLRKRQRSSRLTLSEQMTILLLFQQSHYRNFKHFYLQEICQHLSTAFPNHVSYTRFISLIPGALMPLCAFLQSIQATSEGISFIDSTSIAVCHNKRIKSHKVFKGLAELGKTTKGWFYGFKLHLIINHQGELCACKITPANTDDRQPVNDLTQDLLGKLFADKGYIDQKLFNQLLERGLQLITGIRKNMKNRLMPLFDKLMLRKRSLIESANNQLKSVFYLEHSRHRSPSNGLINMLCAVIAYALYPNKPTLNLSQQELLMLQAA